MRKHLCLLPLASALLLTGCISMAPDFERPEDVVAPAWPADEAVRNAVVLTEGLQQYWREYCDGAVTEEEAMANYYKYINEKYPEIVTP